MRCENCGIELAPGARFCHGCGAEQAWEDTGRSEPGRGRGQGKAKWWQMEVGGKKPRREQKEGLFLQTCNCGCFVIFAIIAIIVFAFIFAPMC